MFRVGCCYSVLNNNELVKLLEEYYNIKNIKALHLYRAFIGDVYFIEDDKQSYVMKIYKSSPLHKKNAENGTNVMEYLWEKGISVPKVFKNRDKLNITTILAPEGERQVIVSSFIEGKAASISYNNEIHKNTGMQLAQMRSAMEDYPFLDRLIKIDEDYLIDNFLKVMNKYFPKKKIEISFLKGYGEIISSKIKELY